MAMILLVAWSINLPSRPQRSCWAMAFLRPAVTFCILEL